MMWYLKKNRKMFLLLLAVILAYNLYFGLLFADVDRENLFYLDMLIGIALMSFVVVDYRQQAQKRRQVKELLEVEDVIYSELSEFENREIVIHDVEILKGQLDEQFEMNCNLQDYITKWCHEVKLPLAALLLMNEKIEDSVQKKAMKEQLERIRQLLNGALIGSRVQSTMYDLQIGKTSLSQCVRASVKNNQFFLIQNRFEMEVSVPELTVYTDKEWLIYVLDQIIGNAIKYTSECPRLSIWGESEEDVTRLYIEDNGEGIKDSDLKNVFEKGFTGSNHHNGKYKSTGMGLYLAHLIMKKLGHTITVESEFGCFTRVILEFRDNRDYFQL